jgi:hypothetical protein
MASSDEGEGHKWIQIPSGTVRRWAYLPGLSIEGYPKLDVPIQGGWDRISKIYDIESWSHLLSDRNRCILTPFGEKVNRQGKRKNDIYNLAVSLCKEIEDDEIRFLEKVQMYDWKDMSPYHRSTFLTRMFIARFLLQLPMFASFGVVKYRFAPNMPKNIRSVDVRLVDIRNPGAGTGFPFRSAMSRLSVREKRWLYTAASRLKKQLARSKTDRELVQVANKWIRFYVTLGMRTQGRGRVLSMVSKVVNLVIMSVAQPLQWHMQRYGWFFIGTEEQRLRKLQMFTRSSRYTYLNESDDVVIKTYDSDTKQWVFMSLDDSSFDAGVRPIDHSASIQMVCNSLSAEDGMVWKGCMYIIQNSPILSPWGLIRIPPWWGLSSGDGGTKITGSTVQALRFESARTAFRHSIEQGFQWLNIGGEFKFNKKRFTIDDFKLKTAMTICQKIYSVRRPRYIHASLMRTFRNLYELESFPQEREKPDLTLVQGILPLVGHPKWKDAVDAIMEMWEIRTPSDHLISMIRRNIRRRDGASGDLRYEDRMLNKLLAAMNLTLR